MDFVHQCSFCGWWRGGETAVMLPPNCRHCGCALDAIPRERAQSEAPAAAAGYSAGARGSVATRLLAVAFALLMLFAAARWGAARGGACGALVAAGAAGFLLLPLIPDRQAPGGGASRPR